MLSHLFVYGTLMTRVNHPMGARLARESVLAGTATIKGQLFDLGSYPALVEDDAEDGVVSGEVHTLASPAASLHWLDAYEGIVPGREGASDYERVQRDVRLDDGRLLTAWVYIYRKPIAGAQRIVSGCWRGPDDRGASLQR